VVKLFPKDYIELTAAGIGVQPQDGGHMPWDEAYSYCKNSTYESLSDWRLPTVDELCTMYEHRSELGYPSGYFWSGDRYDLMSTMYYYVSLSTGKKDYSEKKFYQYVRCVRSIK